MVRAPDDKTVYIGRKPRMAYVIAASKQLNDAGEVVLKAPGKSIPPPSVAVAEIVQGRYIKDATVPDIQIGTERPQDDEGEPAKISSIQILMERPFGADRRPPRPVNLLAGRGPRPPRAEPRPRGPPPRQEE